MSAAPQGRRMPKSLDGPQQILLWPMDEFAIVAVIFGVGIFVKQLTIAIVVIFAFLKLYRKFRDGRQAGYLLHFLYWLGFSGHETFAVRNPFVRRYIP